MNFENLLQLVGDSYQAQTPVVVYSEPYARTVCCLVAEKQAVAPGQLSNRKGFVFSPFQQDHPSYFIAESNRNVFRTDLPEPGSDRQVPEIGRQSDHQRYIDLIDRTVETIKHSEIKKIVISRRAAYSLKGFSVDKLARSLFLSDIRAFKYLWFHPETGLWCGASPETLFKIDNGGFSTMALAATKTLAESNRPWTDKEMKEQQFVSNYIRNVLEPFSRSLQVGELHDRKAGNLLHLCTLIEGLLKDGITIDDVLQKLHPTPAVCGTPMRAALEYILVNEGYNREFYTGYLGPIDHDELSASLYVNLRCAQITENEAGIFVGGGITVQSQAESEWQETCNKQVVMLKVLSEFL